MNKIMRKDARKLLVQTKQPDPKKASYILSNWIKNNKLKRYKSKEGDYFAASKFMKVLREYNPRSKPIDVGAVPPMPKEKMKKVIGAARQRKAPKQEELPLSQKNDFTMPRMLDEYLNIQSKKKNMSRYQILIDMAEENLLNKLGRV